MTDVELAEIVSTWLCHALAGPVGAVVNGMELLKEDPQSLTAETVDLVDLSAIAVAQRLKFFRSVFGASMDGAVDADTAQNLLVAYLVAARASSLSVKVIWPDTWRGAARVDARTVQLALALSLVASACLPRPGSLTVRASTAGLHVAVSGAGARLDASSAAALTASSGGVSGGGARVTPRSAPALFAGSLARRLGAEIVVSHAADQVNFSTVPLG